MSNMSTTNFTDLVRIDMSSIIDEASKVFKDSVAKKPKLVLETIATHSGKIINDRVYTGRSMKTAVPSLVKCNDGAAFDAPFLKNHDRSCEPIGRVKKAEYVSILSGNKWAKDYMDPTKEGSGYTKITSDILDADAIEKFLDGRYQTVSISGKAKAYYCSACTKTTDDLKGFGASFEHDELGHYTCDHYPGQRMKDGSSVFAITDMDCYFEVSQVTTPADDRAIHVNMKMVNDFVDNDWVQRTHRQKAETIDMIQVPVAGLFIYDAEGHAITSLKKDEYKSNKTIVVMPGVETTDTTKTKPVAGEGEIADADFAKARVLDHFARFFNLELTNEDKELVAKSKSTKLTEDQKKANDSTLFISKYIPFSVVDQAHVDAILSLKDKVSIVNDTFVNILEDQAKKENIKVTFTRNNKMTEEQLKAIVADLEASKKTIEKLQTDLAAKDKILADLAASETSKKVDEVMSLRKELGCADMKDFDAKTPEVKQTIVDGYKKLSPETVEFLLKDLREQKTAGLKLGILSTPVANPLTTTDAAPAPAAAPAPKKEEAPVITSSLL